MRLWTLHPSYLDPQGLVALWREALLAQKVLLGATQGYRHHPQLTCFRSTVDPLAAISSYLTGMLEEARRRGYRFDDRKIVGSRFHGTIEETEGQLLYERRHLLRKLRQRDPTRHKVFRSVKVPAPHPLFCIMPGDVREGERVFRPAYRRR
jgi:hypothetical protein